MIPALANASAARPHVLLKTSKGDIELVLYPKKAPKTVKNFLEYVDNGFYSGTIFHRVIPNFVIQGGGYTQDFKQKKTRPPIPLEADNGLDNKRGTIAMARTSDPDSATAQFFINLRDNKNLNHGVYGPGYTVFGKVVKGMSVVDDIAGLSTGAAGPFAQDVPKQAVVIEKAKRLDQGH
jgi:cyclophilin family peptidyl-prolyl cis-trans isomerase